MQNAYKHQANTLKTWMQHDNMKLHAILSKFHIKAHSKRSNGSTHTHETRRTSCPKQQLGILQTSKQYATTPQHKNKRHGHELQVKHYKTRTLSYLQKTLEHAQKDMARLQIITVLDLVEIPSGCQV